MITAFILATVFAFVGWLISLFPAIPIPEVFATSISYLLGILSTISFFLPVEAFKNCFLAVLGVYGIKLLISLSSYVIRKIPTIS